MDYTESPTMYHNVKLDGKGNSNFDTDQIPILYCNQYHLQSHVLLMTEESRCLLWNLLGLSKREIPSQFNMLRLEVRMAPKTRPLICLNIRRTTTQCLVLLRNWNYRQNIYCYHSKVEALTIPVRKIKFFIFSSNIIIFKYSLTLNLSFKLTSGILRSI